MKLKDISLPTSVIESADYVMSLASDVSIDESAIKTLAPDIKQRLSSGTDSVEDAFGTTGNLEGDVNLIFFETAANFCFWAQDDANKWKVEFEGEQSGGWYGLSRAFYKAIRNDIPVHDVSFMSQLSIAQAQEIFAGAGGQPIPLLEARVNNIVETANFLLTTYAGSAHRFVASCNNSATQISEAITRALPSFRDGAWYGDRWVWILKRAQILPNDLHQLTQKYPEFVITDTDKLTIFADYRLPQVLRHHGILKYSQQLSAKVDQLVLIPSGSSEEIEIRMATIKACGKIKEACNLTSAQVDLALWLLSQEMRNTPGIQPHHLTIGSFY